jgi:uncharacterized protein (DUF1499 family)
MTGLHCAVRSGVLRTLAVLALTLPPAGYAAEPAKSIITSYGKLAACPSAPHCVSSDDSDAKHQIAALRIKGDADTAWSVLNAELDRLPRSQTVERRADYRRVVVTTKLLRFKDDVEFMLRPERGEIAMRSSSNVGYYDFNVNRKRLEAIRAALQQRAVVE